MKADKAADEIREAIRQGVFAPGEDLIQDKVAKLLEVSRIPLREALQSLAAMGIVTATPGRGFQVTKLDAEEVDELYGLRLRIEPPLAVDVVGSIRQAQINRLRDLDEAMRQVGVGDRDEKEWAQLNYLFHVELYRSAEQPHTLRFIRQLLDLVTPYSNVYVHRMDGRVRAEGEHGEMVAAIEANDADALERQIQLHLQGAQEAILRQLKLTSSAVLVSRLAAVKNRSES